MTIATNKYISQALLVHFSRALDRCRQTLPNGRLPDGISSAFLDAALAFFGACADVYQIDDQYMLESQAPSPDYQGTTRHLLAQWRTILERSGRPTLPVHTPRKTGLPLGQNPMALDTDSLIADIGEQEASLARQLSVLQEQTGSTAMEILRDLIPLERLLRKFAKASPEDDVIGSWLDTLTANQKGLYSLCSHTPPEPEGVASISILQLPAAIQSVLERCKHLQEQHTSCATEREAMTRELDRLHERKNVLQRIGSLQKDLRAACGELKEHA